MDSPAHVRSLIFGGLMAQAVAAVAKLGVVDELAGGPRSVASLAEAVNASEEGLARLLRACAGAGLFEEVERGVFGLTAAGEWLRSEGPSLRNLAMAIAAPGHWQSMAHLSSTVVSGKAAPPEVFGTGIWEYFTDHPEERAVFAGAMGQISAVVAEEVVKACDVSPFGTIVDVGGSEGVLLARLLQENRQAAGVLFDLPGVVDRAGPVLRERGVADRVETVAGDFFSAVPAGGDLYLLKHILHDWDDAAASRILRTCAAAAPTGSTLLVVERLMGPEADTNALMADLLMFLMFGGRERTEAEYRTMLEGAGYEVEKVTQLSMFGLLEARRS